jgi:lipopolysaccharide transport system ATP-binding protein
MISVMGGGGAISVVGLSKYYKIARNKDDSITAAEAALKRLRHPLRRAIYDEFRALDDVSFEVPFGEAVGIVGRNGAGKSTLLKILTRITAPTTGRITLGGRVGSLLEVGTGFHPELTGRENVYLNGTLLGMRRKEIARRFDEIVAFAGVEKFLETQVKRYSTGMYIRLAFAVAAHLESEILAVDEVLAVGDADFQARCLKKMRQVAQDGRTVLLVSHQVNTVRELCTSAIYLENGRLVPTSSVDDALEHYTASYSRSAEVDHAERRAGSGELRTLFVRPVTEVFNPGEPKEIEFSVPASAEWPTTYFVSVHIVDESEQIVAQCDSAAVGFSLEGGVPAKGSLRLASPWLKSGRYRVDFFVYSPDCLIDVWEGATTFQVTDILPYPKVVGSAATSKGIVLSEFEYREC